MQNQMKILLASLVAIIPLTVLADDYQAGYSKSEKCYRTEYREEYIPGSEENPGYVRSWKDTIEYECNDKEEERICEELETKLYNAQEQDLLRSFTNMGGLN